MRVRRSLLRLLRTRNLVAVTIILMLLYLLKKAHREDEVSDSKAPLELNQNNNNFDNVKSGEPKNEYFVPTTLKKIDWHNRTQIAMEAKCVGLGEQGRAAVLPVNKNEPGRSIQELEAELYSVNGFNGALSDHIHLNRSLPDIRHPKCNSRLYIASLPTVSVVVPFHNEHWSTLLRTAYSVLHRSPEHLIKEVLLVDDASTKEFLKEKLDKYLATSMPKVRVVRVANRSGLITARLVGARAATGDVLIFLDSHTEANVNWLPPLLEPIALDHRTVVCPFIDVVAYDTFEYRAQDEGARGAFDWELFYKRLPVLPSDEANMPEPFASPVMAGGLFAIARAYFWDLGGYDPGLDIWGGEQYELSFKIWQCGGRMVDAPCSRVGHIYRKFAPFPNPAHGDFVGKNYRRVAEVWMDEYAQYLYNRRPHYLSIDPGDLTAQRAIRTRLHCKPFKWFITQIAFDLTHKYPPVEPLPYAEGRIRPIWDNSFCVDASNGGQMDKVQLSYCSGSDEQYFIMSYHKDIRLKSRLICWDLPESADGSPVLLFSCHLGGGNQAWAYKNTTKQIVHSSSACLAFAPDTHSLFVSKCNQDALGQRWTIDAINVERMAKWDSDKLETHHITGPEEPWRG